MSDTKLEILKGDITALEVDAIVNAANEQLAPGGGVCGAIHRAAGSGLAEGCAEVGPCATGSAKMTPGFDLPADYVIHAVGPVWHGGGQGEADQLTSCYRESLRLAGEEGLTSIAFPAISTGVFGYPLEEAAKIAVETVVQEAQSHPSLERVIFTAFDDRTETAYREALAAASQA